MRAVRSVFYLLGTLFALILGIVALVFNLDFGYFKPQAERLVGDILNREFAISGPLHLTLATDGGIELEVNDLRLGNTAWSTESDFAQLRKLHARANLWSAFRDGPIIIESLSVDGLVLNLEHNESGEDNWTFFEPGEPEEEKPTEDIFELPALPEQIQLTDSMLSYSSAGELQPVQIKIDALTEVIQPNRELTVLARGAINDASMNLRVSTDDAEDLLDLRNLEFNLDGAVGEIRFSGELTVDDLLNPKRPAGRLGLSGPSVEYLFGILGVDPVTSGPLDLNFVISPKNDRMELLLDGAFGEFDIAATGDFVDLQKLDDFDIHASADGPDIGHLGALFGIDHIPNEPYTISGRVKLSDGDLSVDDVSLTIDQAQLNLDGHFEGFPDAGGMQGKMRLTIPDIERYSKLLRVPGTLTGPLTSSADIKAAAGGASALIEATVTLADISVQLTGTLVEAPELVGSQLQIALSSPSLQTIASALDLELGPRRSPEQVNSDQSPDRSFKLATTLALTANGYNIKSAQAEVGEESLTLNGVVGREPLSTLTDVTFTASSPNLKRALASYGIVVAQLPEGELITSGMLRGRGNAIEFDETVVNYTGARAEISGVLTTRPELSGSHLRLHLSGPDLTALLPATDALSGLAEPFTLSARAHLEAGELVLDESNLSVKKTSVELSGRLDLESKLQQGKLLLTANSADLLALAPLSAARVDSKKYPVNLQAETHWKDNVWTISALDMNLGGDRLQAKGSVNGPPDFSHANLDIDGQIKAFSRFSRIAGRELPDLPVKINFQLEKKNDWLYFKQFSGKVGDSDLSGDLSLHQAKVPELIATLRSRRLNIRSLRPRPAASEQTVVTTEPKPPKKNAKVIPDTQIPIGLLRNFTAKVNLAIDEILIDAHTLNNVALVAQVADGALSIDHLQVQRGSKGSLAGSGFLRPLTEGATMAVRLQARSFSLGLPAETKEELASLPRYDFNLALISNGRTVREMAGALNGYLWLESGKGKIITGNLDLLTSDFLDQVLATVDPFTTSDPYTNLQCATVLAAVEDGKIIGDPIFVMQSDRINMFANAKANLRSEKIEVIFNTVPQKGLGFSLSTLINPYVMVTGTLANPELIIDPESSLIYGSVAIATGGLSILAIGVKDRFFSSDDPCGDALAGAQKSRLALEKKYTVKK